METQARNAGRRGERVDRVPHGMTGGTPVHRAVDATGERERRRYERRVHRAIVEGAAIVLDGTVRQYRQGEQRRAQVELAGGRVDGGRLALTHPCGPGGVRRVLGAASL